MACQCQGLRVLDYGDHVAIRGLGLEIETANRWRDQDGRHFGVWLRLADGQPASIELVFPPGAPDTVVARVYRLAKGRTFDLVAGEDGVWRMVGQPTSVVACGRLTQENEALFTWLDGGPADDRLVGVALRDARRRYQDEH